MAEPPVTLLRRSSRRPFPRYPRRSYVRERDWSGRAPRTLRRSHGTSRRRLGSADTSGWHSAASALYARLTSRGRRPGARRARRSSLALPGRPPPSRVRPCRQRTSTLRQMEAHRLASSQRSSRSARRRSRRRYRGAQIAAAGRVDGSARRLFARVRCARLGSRRRLGRPGIPRLLPLRRAPHGAPARGRIAASRRPAVRRPCRSPLRGPRDRDRGRRPAQLPGHGLLDPGGAGAPRVRAREPRGGSREHPRHRGGGRRGAAHAPPAPARECAPAHRRGRRRSRERPRRARRSRDRRLHRRRRGAALRGFRCLER